MFQQIFKKIFNTVKRINCIYHHLKYIAIFTETPCNKQKNN